MPYPQDDYISLEEQIRRQQQALTMGYKGQPYAEDQYGDRGNIDVESELAQQMGTADYAELLRQGASAQKGAATTHYNPLLAYQKGRYGKGELPAYSYASGQRPQPLALQTATPGLAAGLTQMGIKRGLGQMQAPSGWQQNIGPYGLTGAERVALNPGFVNQYANPESGLLSSDQMLDPLATGRGLAQMGDFGLQTGMQLWENTSPHELYRTTLIERGATQPQAQQPSTGGAAGAGMAAGALTSYLINRYTDAPPGVGEIAGGVAGGGVSSGMSGMVAGQAVTAAGGGAVGAGMTAAAAGGIYGGAIGLAGYVLSQMAMKHIFGAGKMSGKDVGAQQLYEQYHGKGVGKTAQAIGFEGNKSEAREAMLKQPYAWMSEDAQKFRELNPNFDYSKGTLEQRGYQRPEYKPTKWEAWVGGMSNEGYKMKNILDATAYYASEKGTNARKEAAKAYNRGEDWYLNPENDRTTFQVKEQGAMRKKGGDEVRHVQTPYHGRHVTYMERHGLHDQLKAQQDLYDKEREQITSGKGLYTTEERQQQWKDVQANYETARLPWQGEKFEQQYEGLYGGMKDKPDYSRYTGKKGMKRFHKDFGKRSWYERHNEMGKYYKNLAKYVGTGPGMGKYDIDPVQPTMPTSAKVGDRFARMGIEQNTNWDNRELFGPKRKFLDVRRTTTGNTGGDGGHDTYGYEGIYEGDELDYEG